MPVGINRFSGKVLTDLSQVNQSLGVIFTTRIGERILRRTFGSAIPALFGKNLTPSTLLKFWTAVVLAVELWEKRLKITKIAYPSATNSTAALRVGAFGIAITADSRPRAYQGDFTVERTITI